MGPLSFADGKKLDVASNIMIIDSGVSYALIPTEDFNKLTDLLSKNYGVTCKAGERKEESNS
jgi:predicted aspartyl protease